MVVVNVQVLRDAIVEELRDLVGDGVSANDLSSLAVIVHDIAELAIRAAASNDADEQAELHDRIARLRGAPVVSALSHANAKEKSARAALERVVKKAASIIIAGVLTAAGI